MSTQQYEEIGGAFGGFKALPLAHYAKVPSFLAMAGDVRGKSVLDLAKPDHGLGGSSPRLCGFLSERTGDEAETGPRVRIAAPLDPPIGFVATCPRRFGADCWADLLASPPLEMPRCRA
ncbi:hypothetical protein [Streptomyces sp. SM11]|uniref:hypothetical protein n=1 Tax=Streptomyces sp. SM11 TaxID=565557 RepID=UPI000CD5250F|nr:hypothetical protein [Streptomyces sp. SM11]